MKYIKIRYIIGTLAIIAIVVMNFTYAHNNYGIPKMNGITKANATTTAPAYREEKRASYKNCPRYAYDVVIYSRRYPKDSLFVEQDPGWLGSAYILRRIPFLSLNLSKHLQKPLITPINTTLNMIQQELLSTMSHTLPKFTLKHTL